MAENQERIEKAVKAEIALNREETSKSARQGREELGATLNSQLEIFSKQLISLTKLNEDKLERMRETMQTQLAHLQEDNSKKLEQMRMVVDEKLHATLEKRLGDSFRLVSERLELVHKGLGEMQTLATGVGDLKRVLTNVKTRGTWGEIQLENLLEQILAPEQFAKNVVTKRNSNKPVEFAIKLPGKDDNIVWMPIDAKFPKEDYERLLQAQEQSDQELVDAIGKELENRIKAEAKDIRDKYLDPPHTTDFGILFLPIEGLYAEVLRRPGLYDLLQREYRVALTGPTTIAAFLNSLQMGFRTLAIEKRASEVWNLLGTVKTEFGKFGDLLDKTHKKLQEASNTIESASRKSRTIERKLRNVQVLQSLQPSEAIELQANGDDEE